MRPRFRVGGAVVGHDVVILGLASKPDPSEGAAGARLARNGHETIRGKAVHLEGKSRALAGAMQIGGSGFARATPAPWGAAAGPRLTQQLDADAQNRFRGSERRICGNCGVHAPRATGRNRILALDMR